uniref:NudC domain-containing protein 2-like n=1 Tax=Phallusia mammillata TaxID=59560 RepID=A0A6F9DMR6_9ASCI|nr:nudC domain-containing protein 2-like [Phallusia mammillata]
MSVHFDERSGIVDCSTPWGRWYQTAEEVYVEINSSSPIKGRDVSVKYTSTHISCTIKQQTVFEGDLPYSIIVDESTWSVEDQKLVRILLAKSLRKEDPCWKSLLANGDYSADPFTFDEMQKKLTLEKYQVDQPGFDFGSAALSGNYAS